MRGRSPPPHSPRSRTRKSERRGIITERMVPTKSMNQSNSTPMSQQAGACAELPPIAEASSYSHGSSSLLCLSSTTSRPTDPVGRVIEFGSSLGPVTLEGPSLASVRSVNRSHFPSQPWASKKRAFGNKRLSPVTHSQGGARGSPAPLPISTPHRTLQRLIPSTQTVEKDRLRADGSSSFGQSYTLQVSLCVSKGEGVDEAEVVVPTVLFGPVPCGDVEPARTSTLQRSPSPRPLTQSVPALGADWVRRIRDERASVAHTLQLAQCLFLTVVRDNPRFHLSTATAGRDSMIVLATRAAVSCVLLDEVMATLPRHQRVLVPCISSLIQLVFVPNTKEMRQVLGSVELPEIVEDIVTARAKREELMECNTRPMGMPGLGPASIPGTPDSLLDETKTYLEPGRGVPVSGDPMRTLLKRYARKPYLLGHLELSQMVVDLAHRNRSREVHQQHLPDIVTLVGRNWMATYLRTVLRGWHALCLCRRLTAQKKRGWWAQKISSERLQLSLRRWRSYAAIIWQQAEANNRARALIAEKKESLRRFEAETNGLQSAQASLMVALEAKGKELEQTDKASAEKERLFKRLLEQVRELDRVGSMLLRSLLLPDALPDMANGTETAGQRPEALLQDGSTGASVAHLACRTVPPEKSLEAMVAWAHHMLATHGQTTEELCADTTKMSKCTSPLQSTRRGSEHASADAEAIARSRPTPPSLSLSGSERGPHNNTSRGASLSTKGLTPLTGDLLGSVSASNEDSYRNAAPAPFEDLLREEEDGVALVPMYQYLVLMRSTGEDGSHLPTIDAVRTVKAADATVLEEFCRVCRATRAHDGFSPLEGPSKTAGNVHPRGGTVYDSLSMETRETAEQVARVLVDAYERFTGTTSPVDAACLAKRERRGLLVFLAALLHYYTNWLVRKLRSDTTDPHGSLNETGDSALAAGVAALQTARSVGRRHPKFLDWYYPPNSHQDWMALVENQKQWVRLSFNAMHQSLELATRPPTLLTMEEQDVASVFLSRFSITRLRDLLPQSPEMVSRAYVDMVGAVQHFMPKLRLIFQMYALPYGDIQSAQREAGRESGSVAEAGHPFETTSKEGLEVSSLYVTANGLWHLLRDAGVAGVSERGLHHEGTLHRAAVMSIVESTVFHRTSGESIFSESRRSSSETAKALPVRCVGAKHQVPYFTRAVQEGGHVDWRYDRGTICMNAGQFTEALLRCAHCWQCVRTARQAAVFEECSLTSMMNSSVAKGADHRQSTDISARNSRLSHVLQQESITSPLAPQPPLRVHKEASLSKEGGAVPPKETTAASRSSGIRYEGGCYDTPLQSTSLIWFLWDGLLPYVLGGADILSPFRRAIRRPAVCHLIAQVQDGLFDVFTRFAKPREAVGLRSALPPPYHGAIAGRFSSTARAVTSALTGRAASPVPQPRDVGIVSVMTLADVYAMSNELCWRLEPRLTEAVLKHCYDAVLADTLREGDALFFLEFIDLICALAYYVNVDPFVPLEEKLKVFLGRRVLPSP